MNDFEVERSRDGDFLGFLFEELRFDITVDQFTKIPDPWVVLELPSVFFLTVREKGWEPEGGVLSVKGELHTLFLPSLRGARAIRAGKAVIEWFWRNTDASGLTSYFLSHRPDVKFFARRLGFIEASTEPTKFTVGGRPVSKTILFLPRPCPPSPL